MPAVAPAQTVVVEGARSGEGITVTASQESVDLTGFRARAVETADVLEALAGVDVLRLGGTGQGAFVRIRGSSAAQVVVLVDGVRMNPVTGGGADLDAIPLELFERVDVARGAGAIRSGADAVGGVVSFRSAAAKQSAASVSAGSFGSVRASVATVARARGWTFDVGARQERSEESFRHYDALRGESRVQRNVGGTSFGGAAGGRGALAGGEALVRVWGTSARGGAPGLTEWPTVEARHGEEHGTLLLRWSAPSSGLRPATTVEASQRIEELRYRDPDPILGSEPIEARSSGRVSSGSVLTGGLLFRGLALVAGADARHESVSDLSTGEHERIAGGAHAELTTEALEGALEATAGLRLDAVDERRGEEAARSTDVVPLPSAGVIWRIAPWISVRGHGGRVYRIPTFTERWLPDLETVRGNPDLEPEDGWTGDLGVSFHGARRGVAATLDATAFGTTLDDAILFAPVAAYAFGPVNTGPAWIAGGELGVSADIARRVQTRLAWTRTESFRVETGAPLPGRPRDRLAGRIAARLPGSLQPFVEASYASPSYADFFGNLTVPGGTLVGAGLTFAVDRGPVAGLAVTLEGKNLTDSDVRDGRFLPQPGRAAWITLSWRTPPTPKGAPR